MSCAKWLVRYCDRLQRRDYKVVQINILAHKDDLQTVIEQAEDLMVNGRGWSIDRQIRKPTNIQWKFFRRETEG